MIYKNIYLYYKMSVIIYRAKNYKPKGVPTKLVHKIYPNGIIDTIESDEHCSILTRRYKKRGNLYEEVYYQDYGENTQEFYKNNYRHRDNDEPAFIKVKNCSTVIQEWYVEGLLHRDEGPARTCEYEEEGIYIHEFYKNGEKIF